MVVATDNTVNIGWQLDSNIDLKLGGSQNFQEYYLHDKNVAESIAQGSTAAGTR